MQADTASLTERRVFLALALACAGVTLAVMPWARLPGPRVPQIIAVCNSGIALADICTALLLAREFRHSGRLPFLLLACAYLFGALMALTQVLAFPGAVLPAPLFGNAQTPAWLFLAWRLGTASLFVAAVETAKREPSSIDAPMAALRRAWLCTLAVFALVVIAADALEFPVTLDTRFTAINLGAIVLYFGLCGYALARIWSTPLSSDRLFLWLSMVLIASVADQVLPTYAGGQYTLGWHLGKAGAVVSACLLLVFWLGNLSARDRASPLHELAGYGAAFVVTLAALLLRWFMQPWVGYDVPFATLFGAVALSVWVAGWKPATAAALAGFVAASQLFLDPAGAFRERGVAAIIGAVIFWGSCALIIGLGESLRRARDRYQSAERRFRSSQEVSIQGYAMLTAVRDGDGKIHDFRFEYINPQGAQMARTNPESLVGRTLREALPATERSGVFDAFVKVSETGEPSDREYRYEYQGEEGWFRLVLVKVGDGVSASFFDITKTKRLEGELRTRAAELQRADANKSEFLAVLSHELRNPLAPLLNGLTLLSLQKDPRDIADTRSMMGRQIHNLRRLIDDLLDVSRIDRGKLELLRERVSVDAIVRNAIEISQPGIEAKSHELVARYWTSPLYVEGDPVRLTQIVSNLLGNAAKFTPVGGRIEVSVHASGELAAITVEDNGIGFEAGDEERVFDMFVQLPASRRASTGGLGLGLTLARRLAEMHGGTVEAHSAGPGQGAQFVLRVPLSRTEHAPRTEDTHVSPVKVVRRVLVVDDNADAADSLAKILELEGFDVRAYHDPVRALDAASEFKPDVAFIDLNMPRMTGTELAERLRSLHSLRSIRLVAVTGMGQQGDLEATAQAGFHAHLTKPAPPDRVLALAAGEPDRDKFAAV
jgi:two-component system CheB/CheR fusion protein